MGEQHVSCCRSGCQLTALWQVGFLLQPRWDDRLEPVTGWTGLLVCGLHKEDVLISDFAEILDKVANGLTHGHPDALRQELNWQDISDGKWWNPNKPGKRTRLDLSSMEFRAPA